MALRKLLSFHGVLPCNVQGRARTLTMGSTGTPERFLHPVDVGSFVDDCIVFVCRRCCPGR